MDIKAQNIHKTAYILANEMIVCLVALNLPQCTDCSTAELSRHFITLPHCRACSNVGACSQTLLGNNLSSKKEGELTIFKGTTRNINLDTIAERNVTSMEVVS